MINTYLEALQLSSDQAAKFKMIILKFTPKFKEENISVLDYNTLMKKETLEIYGILDKEQFTTYKKLKDSIEPNKKYRIENSNE